MQSKKHVHTCMQIHADLLITHTHAHTHTSRKHASTRMDNKGGVINATHLFSYHTFGVNASQDKFLE